jgi:hypothetical protein
MVKPHSITLGVLLVILGSAPSLAQLAPETIQRVKKATALVEVTTAKAVASGSAFCVDKSGLFITNAHVVLGAGKEATVRLVLDIGLDSQRGLEAKVLRHDDRMDLALLEADVAADSGLTALDLGRDADLKELDRVITFGYPFGHAAAVGRARYPDITVLSSRITSLRKSGGRLQTVQFDNQLNPGNSGGPVLDGSGKVIGVAVATVRASALNMAIPIGKLADFLTAPGLVFDPPPVVADDREKPVTWKIQVQPPTPTAKIPDNLSVAVTVPNEAGQPSEFPAQPLGDGIFEAKVIPTPRAPMRRVDLIISTGNLLTQYVEVRLKDDDVMAGGSKLILSAVNLLFGGPELPNHAVRGQIKTIPGLGVGRGRTEPRKIGTVDLSKANQISVEPLNWPAFRALMAEVDAKQGSKVVATVRKRVDFTGGLRVTRAASNVIVSLPRPVPPPMTYGPLDEGRLDLGGILEIASAPVGAGKSIRPPKLASPAARPSTEGEAAETPPLIKKLEGTISDVVVGGGGRYLLLTLSDAGKLAIFDTSAAEIVKTIPLPSPNAIVAAGATKFLIAFPEQKLIQRWNLETLRREGGSRALPIKGRLKSLVLGSDSNGPALAFWSIIEDTHIDQTVFSFIDLESLKVQRVVLIAGWGTRGIVSASGGSFRLLEFANSPSLKVEPLHMRASADGTLYTMWDTSRLPSGFQTLKSDGRVLMAVYKPESLGLIAPGPDGQTVFTGRAGRLDMDGNPLGHDEPKPPVPHEQTLPSSDPAYYLSISGLVGTAPVSRQGPTSSSGGVKTSIHATSSGARLLTVGGLSEMADAPAEDRRTDGTRIISDFTIDKRFHLVPAAGLLITIPVANDRLVLRRIDLGERK